MQNNLKDRLINRVNDNLYEFETYLYGLARRRLIASAGRIAAVNEAYSYLTTEYECNDECELEYLLLFKNPLMMLADEWQAHRDDYGVDIEVALCRVLYSADNLDEYALARTAADAILTGRA